MLDVARCRKCNKELGTTEYIGTFNIYRMFYKSEFIKGSFPETWEMKKSDIQDIFCPKCYEKMKEDFMKIWKENINEILLEDK